jgi:hypothetical protein
MRECRSYRRIRAGAILPAIVAGALLVQSAAFGAATLDQSQTTFVGAAGVFSTLQLGQTFTAGLSGQLDHVDMLISEAGDPAWPATVSIVQTVSGSPSGSVLGSVFVPTFTAGWFSIDFLPQSITLTSGVQYGITFSVAPSQTQSAPWAVQWFGDPYPAGHFWQYTSGPGWALYNPFGNPADSDAAFKTWMFEPPAVPAPGAVLLVGVGTLLTTWFRKRRAL